MVELGKELFVPCCNPALSFSVLVWESMMLKKGMLVVPRTWPLWSVLFGSGAVPSNIPLGRASTHWLCVCMCTGERSNTAHHINTDTIESLVLPTHEPISRSSGCQTFIIRCVSFVLWSPVYTTPFSYLDPHLDQTNLGSCKCTNPDCNPPPGGGLNPGYNQD